LNVKDEAMEWGKPTYVTKPTGNRPICWRDFPDLVDSYNDHVNSLSRLNLAGGKMSGPTVIKAKDNPNPETFNSDTCLYTDSRIRVDVYFDRQFGKYFYAHSEDND
jgi:hypothetical protein